MKKLYIISLSIILGLLITPHNSLAQDIHFVLDKAIELKCPGEHFGGISAIEYLEDRNITLLFSDKDENHGASHAFIMYKYDSIREITPGLPGIGNYNDIRLREIESFRYNKKLKKFYFSYESDQTGIGCIESGSKQKIIFTEETPTNNRGIESLTFTSNNNMWVAEESGKSTSCDQDTFTNFYKFAINKNGEYGNKPVKQLTYPLKRCSCTNGQSFNGGTGNGISEILALDNNRLLVMERCWNGNPDSESKVMLYLATINERAGTLSKQLLCDINLLLKGKIKVDNLEGMTWGKPINGKRTLYLVSDDNFRSERYKKRQPNQITELIVLREAP